MELGCNDYCVKTSLSFGMFGQKSSSVQELSFAIILYNNYNVLDIILLILDYFFVPYE
jgi:hypothetical protein